jgi:hypothetical protein
MSRYKVKNEHGMEVCTGILQLFFGNQWETDLNRLAHQFDGYIRSLYFSGQAYRIYRAVDDVENRSVPAPKDRAIPSTAAYVG